jgi:hypothetical protein
MSDQDLTTLETFDLPYSRKAELREASFDSGMKMLRLVLREGRRITQVDMDSDIARAMADAMTKWADAQDQGK